MMDKFIKKTHEKRLTRTTYTSRKENHQSHGSMKTTFLPFLVVVDMPHNEKTKIEIPPGKNKSNSRMKLELNSLNSRV